MGRVANSKSGRIVVMGVPERTKLYVERLAKEDLMDISSFMRRIIKKELDSRRQELENIEKYAV